MSLIQSRMPCHDCGSSDALAEYTTATYCFSCGTHTSKVYKKSCGAQMEDVPGPDEPLVVPRKATSRMTMDAIRWLWKYDISDEQIALYGIKYVAEGVFLGMSNQEIYYRNRVFLPCYGDQGDIKFYQLRSIDKQEPKYYTAGKKDLFISKQFQTQYVVLVEDMLSAIRVGELASCIGLMGTSLDDKKALTIASKYDMILIWMDGDKAGREASKKLKKKLELLADVVEIKTDRDPKCHKIAEIEGNISVALKKLDLQ